MTSVEALQAWLALEHEAVWFYPVVGARRDDLVDRATTSFEAHRDTRDVLLGRLRGLDVTPVEAELSYVAGPLRSAVEARTAAQSLESRIGAACLVLTGLADDDLIAWGVRSLRRAALAEQAWGAGPKPFPGLP